MKAKLYELSAEMADFERFCEENPDIEKQVILDTLSAIKLNFEQKAMNVYYMIANISVPLADIDKELERLKKKRANIEKSVEFWKNGYLKFNMEKAKIDVIENKVGKKIRLQDSTTLDVFDAKKLPIKYVEIVPSTLKPENKLIKDDLKAGKKVPGAKLVKDKYIKFY